LKRPSFDENWPPSWKTSYFYDLEEVYGPISNRGYAYAYQKRHRETIRLLTEALEPGARILDLAAAQGNFSLTLAEMGYDVTWNDMREELADYVRLKHERGKLSFAPGNAFEIKAASLFDGVLITEIIEHMAHPDEFLTRVAGLIRPGGYIVMTSPNGAYFRNHLPKFSECSDPAIFETLQFKPDSDGHIFLLHPEEVEALAHSAGLEMERFVLLTNPLTSGHMKTKLLLRVLPKRLVVAIENITSLLPRRLTRRLLTQMAARFRKPETVAG